MQIIPGDDIVIGPMLAADYAVGSDIPDETSDTIQRMLGEARTVLAAIDGVISTDTTLESDKEWVQLRVQWGILGPQLYSCIQRVERRTHINQLDIRLSTVELHRLLVGLTIRRQTLEINGIEVLK